MMLNGYYYPDDRIGVGSEIKWCGKHSGGKRCMLCKHHVDFATWSSAWRWHYLISWGPERGWKGYRNYANDKYSWRVRWGDHTPYPYRIQPGRYRTHGLSEYEFANLLKRGCRPKKACTCISLVQRGSWYCLECWDAMQSMAKNKNINIHELITTDRKELKEEALIMRLSGIL